VRAHCQRGREAASRLLAVAEHLFASRGFLGVSITDILAESGATRPVLYYHFGNKEGLYLAVVQRVTREYTAALASAGSEDASITERIHRVCRAHVAAKREWALFEPRARVATTRAVTPAEDDGRPTTVAGVVEALVREGIACGEIVTCEASSAALALVGAAEATLDQVKSSDNPSEDRLDEVVDLVLRGLTPREAP
jgi:TetR/AcrR family transcriptional regulator